MVQDRETRGSFEEPDGGNTGDWSTGRSAEGPRRRPLFDAGQMGAPPSWARGAERVAAVTPVDDHTGALLSPADAAGTTATDRPAARSTPAGSAAYGRAGAAAHGFEHTSDIPPIPREKPEELRTARLPATRDADLDLEEDHAAAQLFAGRRAPEPEVVEPAAVQHEVVLPAATAATAAGGKRVADQELAVPAQVSATDETVTLDLDEVRVPVVEERLVMEKHPVVQGELLIDRRVEEREETVAVDVQREALRLVRRQVAPRPAVPGDTPFVERTLTIPVFGEHAQARKQTVISGELVVHRRLRQERQAFQARLRREVVTVDDDFDVHRMEDVEIAREEAEASYRRGFEAAQEPRFAGRDFEQVEQELRQEYEETGFLPVLGPAGTAPAAPQVAPEERRSLSRWRHVLEEVKLGWSRARAAAQEGHGRDG
jgi:stress response protein YsnF